MDNSADDLSLESIAVIGLTGRFPGADSTEQFWQNLRDGVESISALTDEELVAGGVDPALLRHPNYVKAAAVLTDVGMFDAAFFGFSPREAEITDPQHRLFLECSWEVLEKAGYDPETYKGAIGVYAGVGISSYLMNIYTNPGLLASIGGLQAAISNDKDHLPTRVSYKLNLKGPSVTVQSACSTSLVAVHLACQSLLSYQCDMALAGGVTINSEKAGYIYQKGGIHSPDGHCRAFDANAQGTVGGNGLGIVLLKRLSDALSDGDSILAVIKGSAINNDGSLKIGYTAPSVSGQAAVIAMAQAVSDVDPETISYIEAHGTATPLGDPIELAALSQAFSSTNKRQFCALGSVKSNIGHLDTAAGIAGLIKTVLALHHRLIPPSLHFHQPNPEIDFANSPFFVNTQLTEWKSNGTALRAGVSSFGIGGTNAHLILEEAPPAPTASPTSRSTHLLLLSARSQSALDAATARLATHLRQESQQELADVAYTLGVGRRAFSHRRTLVCESREQAIAALEGESEGRLMSGRWEAGARSVVWMFPGQGAQYAGMGRGLYEQEEVFRRAVERCSEVLKEETGMEVREILYGEGRELKETEVVQPLLFTIEYGLSEQWKEWGVEAEAMIGHSVGEYVAAVESGVLEVEEGLRLVAERGRLMQQLPHGAMLVVAAKEEEVQDYLGRELSLAAVNGPEQCVASGSIEAIEELQHRLTERGVGCRRLEVSHAFHSSMMDSIIEPFTEQVRKVKLQAPQIPYISNVTGRWITAEEATDPDYWARHLRQTVRYHDGLTQLLKDGSRVLIEMGPGHALGRLARRRTGKEQVIVSTLRGKDEREISDQAYLMKALGEAWTAGARVDWEKVYAGERRRRVVLPTYPFERQHYWIDRQKSRREEGDSYSLPKVLARKADLADWFYVPSWKRSVLPQFAEDAGQSAGEPKWLVFFDEFGIGKRMVERLEMTGREVISVFEGEAYTQLAETIYAINPQRPGDYDLLLKELNRQGRMPRRIVHLWSVTPLTGTQPAAESFEESQHLGFYSLLFLAQALGTQIVEQTEEHLASGSLEIKVVTTNLHAVTGEEEVRPEKATLAGLCKVIPQEYPNINCRIIDTILDGSGTRQQTKALDQLLLEVTANSSDPVVAYRGSHRWVQTFEPLRLEERDGDRKRLREGGVYLITGGLGGVGLELAEWLAQRVRAKLVLVGRNGLPEREEWEHWLASREESDEVSRKIRKVQTLEELGAKVLVCPADVTDEGQMREVKALAEARFGKINGLIHAAGVPPQGLIQLKTGEAVANIFAPKIRGTQVLDALFREDGLDFIIFCSSLRSFLGYPGGADYSAANAYLDAFAQRLASTGQTFSVSINWDGWREVGMGADPVRQPEPFAVKADEEAMSSAEGVEVFGRILSCELPQVIVSVQDFPARVERNILSASRDLEALRKKELKRPAHPRPQLDNPYVAPRNEVERRLAELWQSLLGIDQVGVHDNFFDLGGDSILSIQVAAKINQAGIQLTPKHFFEHQTIAGLAAAAAESMPEAVAAEQGVVSGPLPLVPLQRAFLERNPVNPHHFNQAVLLEVRQPLDAGLLERALQHLLAHHDQLRLRLTEEAGEWRSEIRAEAEGQLQFSRMDLSGLTEAEQRQTLETVAAEAQASLDLCEGPLLSSVLFELGAHTAARLLIIIHHFVIDAVSWRILLEDLQTACQQLEGGREIKLGPKTTSYKQWAEQLAVYANSTTIEEELDYWLAEGRTKVPRLPVDCPEGANTEGSKQRVTVSLTAEETQALLQEAPAAYHTQITDLLLTALVQATGQWTGKPLLTVDLEGHGREALVGGVDLSRTVGWYTTIFPVLLEVEEAGGPGVALKAVKEQLRAVPKRGLGYGLLRYVRKEDEAVERLRALPPAEIGFLYLGQFDQAINEAFLFSPAAESSGPTSSPQEIRTHLLEVVGSITGGQLKLTWYYSRNLHLGSTIELVAGKYIEALRSIIIHCQSPQARGYTPSDFAEAGVTQRELDEIISELVSEGGS